MLRIGNIDSFAFIVQSSTYDPEEIDFYIEECLGYYEAYLTKITNKEFENMKNAL